MPGARMVYIPHPVQLLTDDELNARADAIFPDVLAALTGGESDRSPGGATGRCNRGCATTGQRHSHVASRQRPGSVRG